MSTIERDSSRNISSGLIAMSDTASLLSLLVRGSRGIPSAINDCRMGSASSMGSIGDKAGFLIDDGPARNLEMLPITLLGVGIVDLGVIGGLVTKDDCLVGVFVGVVVCSTLTPGLRSGESTSISPGEGVLTTCLSEALASRCRWGRGGVGGRAMNRLLASGEESLSLSTSMPTLSGFAARISRAGVGWTTCLCSLSIFGGVFGSSGLFIVPTCRRCCACPILGRLTTFLSISIFLFKPSFFPSTASPRWIFIICSPRGLLTESTFPLVCSFPIVLPSLLSIFASLFSDTKEDSRVWDLVRAAKGICDRETERGIPVLVATKVVGSSWWMMNVPLDWEGNGISISLQEGEREGRSKVVSLLFDRGWAMRCVAHWKIRRVEFDHTKRTSSETWNHGVQTSERVGLCPRRPGEKHSPASSM